MFAESLLESGNVHRKGRGLATTLSITIQGLLLAALVALPLFRPDALSLQIKSLVSPVALGRPDLPQPEHPNHGGGPATESRPLTEPKEIPTSSPNDARNTSAERPPEPCMSNCHFIPGNPMGVNVALGTALTPATPVSPAKPIERVTVSVLELGRLVSQAQPIYPPIAVQTRMEGSVVLRALIDREGRIATVQVLSGHPMFLESAKGAVRQWRYRPYLLNGQPVEVETQITVNFKLSR